MSSIQERIVIRPLIAAMLCAVCGLAALGCTLFNKYGAASLKGHPDSTGFVVVDSRVDVIAAILDVHTVGMASGGVLARADGEHETAHAGMAEDLLVFSGLHPGRWQLVSIDGVWAAGRNPANQRFHVPADQARELTFDVRAGEPVYLGVVDIVNDRRVASQGVRFQLKPDPAAEKKAWTTLAKIYGDGEWGTPLRAKL
jgi:hypothetical protein